MGNPIKVRLKTNNEDGVVLHPETEWSIVLNRPSIEKQFSDNPSNPDNTNSIINKVSGVLGRDGEGWNTYKNNNNSIVVGNDKNALGFCGSNSGQLQTILQSKHNTVITTEANINLEGKNVKLTGETNVDLKGTQININADNIMVKSKDTGHLSLPLSSYPIKANVDWNDLKGRPFHNQVDLKNYDNTTAMSSFQNAVFGIYISTEEEGFTVYPAFATVYVPTNGGSATRTMIYYLTGAGVFEQINGSDEKNFHGFLSY